MARSLQAWAGARYAPAALDRPHILLMGIPKGYPGTRRTAEQMSRLIREGAKDFDVRQKAIDILLDAGVRPKDYLGEIRALFQWVQRNVRYTKDPFNVELLHSPRRMLELRAGDCDDMSILLGAMLEAVGHPVRLVLVGADPSRPRLFSHVYLEARHQGRWIALDPTMPHHMGWAPRAPNRQVIAVRRGPDTTREDGGTHAMTYPQIGLAQDELVQALGPGIVGEVRQGPDGNLYRWTAGADGLGNPVGFWNLIPMIASAAAPLLQNLFRSGSPTPAPAPPPPAITPGAPPAGFPLMNLQPLFQAAQAAAAYTEQGTLEVLRGVQGLGLPARDPRVRALWAELRRRGVLRESPWLRAVLLLIWRDGLAARERPRTVRRIAQELNRFGLLPAGAADLARGGRRGRTRGQRPARFRRRRPRSLRLSQVPTIVPVEPWS